MIEKIILYIKGFIMGIADLIPGVSGGTIALVSGIYTELLRTIVSFNLANLKILLTGNIKQACANTNLIFLLPLLLGIASAIFSLSHLIHYLLANHDILVWAFFLGLVIGSVFLLTLELKRFSALMMLCFLLSMVSTYFLLNFVSFTLTPTYLGFFIAGTIAICAMILPGISGSFLLLIMGMYKYVISAIKQFDITYIAIFAAGAIVGLMSFSRLLNFLFKQRPRLTMATMIGVMVGSANKLWPWQVSGTDIGLEAKTNKLAVLPDMYQAISLNDPQLVESIVSFIAGLTFVIVLHHFSKRKKT